MIFQDLPIQLYLLRSDDYSSNVNKSTLKAVLLNKVIVGKGCKMTHDNTTLTAPPPGYDSVRLFNPVMGVLCLTFRFLGTS